MPLKAPGGGCRSRRASAVRSRAIRGDTRPRWPTDPILEPLRADPARAAILCDIDGTLAPIVDDPEAAAVPPEAREVLAALADRYALVACVTGRRALAARRIVGLDQLTYAGNHGFELLAPGDAEPAPRPARSATAAAAAAGFVARLDWVDSGRVGLRLEDKGPIQAIHWRGAADAGRPRHSGPREIGPWRPRRQGLVPHLGRMVLELRPLADGRQGDRRAPADRRGRASAARSSAATTAPTSTRSPRCASCAPRASSSTRSASASPRTRRRRRSSGDADLVVAGPREFLELLRSL